MLLSLNWLKDFINLPPLASPKDIAEKITLHTAEVEGVRALGENFDKIVVGEVVKIKPHPNADKLNVVETKISAKKIVEIVCGGINLKEGMKVAVALPGAKVRWHGNGDFVELKSISIRGVESLGMICASEEIGLGAQFPAQEIREIMDISFVDAAVGTPLQTALGLESSVLEIDNKSITHRPDLWGHYGMARELSAMYKTALKKLPSPNIPAIKTSKLSVEVTDKKLCSRYMGARIDGIRIEPSPDWMKKRLEACGIRAINNIIDITNYCMLEFGQPMHAFDTEKLNGVIRVRKAKKGEKIIALDENEYELTADDLLIADEKYPIAIAGVMGGQAAAVDKNTTSIIFESANFDAASVRKTSLRLGLRSESSARFEKELDPHNCEIALKRAVELTKKLCSKATVASNVADVKAFKLNAGPIIVSHDFIEKRIGITMTEKEVKDILERLGFQHRLLRESQHSVLVPTWRAQKDISIPEDIVEEVARMYGYQNIPQNMPRLTIAPPPVSGGRKLERRVADFFTTWAGMTETANYSYVSEKHIVSMGEDFSVKNHLELENPISKEAPYLRQTLISGLLKNVEKNLAFFDRVELFEIGTVFFPETKGPKESPKGKRLPWQKKHAAIAVCQKGLKNPYAKALEIFTSLFSRLGYEYVIKKPAVEKKFLHPYRQSEIHVHGKRAAFVGEAHPLIAKNFGIRERVALAKVNLDTLLDAPTDQKKYRPVPVFPPAFRDIAFVIDEKIRYEDVQKEIQNSSPLVFMVELFDIYRGKNIAQGKKSMSFHVAYLAYNRTLKHEEVEQAHKDIISALHKKFGAKVR